MCIRDRHHSAEDPHCPSVHPHGFIPLFLFRKYGRLGGIHAAWERLSPNPPSEGFALAHLSLWGTAHPHACLLYTSRASSSLMVSCSGPMPSMGEMSPWSTWSVSYTHLHRLDDLIGFGVGGGGVIKVNHEIPPVCVWCCMSWQLLLRTGSPAERIKEGRINFKKTDTSLMTKRSLSAVNQ